jgi:hypothetical protein
MMDEKETRNEMPPNRPSADMEKTSSDDADNEKIYPPKKVVLPTMLALFLVFFLVALVSKPSYNPSIILTI